MYEQSKAKPEITGRLPNDHARSDHASDFWSHWRQSRSDKASAFVNLRAHVRRPVRMNALLYLGSSFQTVRVKDLSRGGAGLERCGALHVGDRVVISLVSGRKLDGVVKWWLAGNCGVQFDVPLASDDALLAAKAAEQA